jgi:hypothetical protein
MNPNPESGEAQLESNPPWWRVLVVVMCDIGGGASLGLSVAACVDGRFGMAIVFDMAWFLCAAVVSRLARDAP